MLTTRIPESLAKKVRLAADDAMRSVAAQLQAIIEEWEKHSK